MLLALLTFICHYFANLWISAQEKLIKKKSTYEQLCVVSLISHTIHSVGEDLVAHQQKETEISSPTIHER